MDRGWDSPIYGFFKPIPKIADIDGRRVHVFECMAKGCIKKAVNRYIDKGDATSTGNMTRHAKNCFGEDAVKRVVKATMTPGEVRQRFGKNALESGDVTSFFERKGKGPVTYSHRQHTRTETRYSLLKTGRPGYWIPSASTVARDVKTLFTRSRTRISRLLREYEGRLSISTDCWSSPNGNAFMAVIVHFEHDGEPLSMVLDVVEVAKSHTGQTLGETQIRILCEFGIKEMVCASECVQTYEED
ncbi:uncharacterized protein BXZ73DRAFT_52866 [Epithele typhae]|uniref:uncharacterized protein n=1 Tax=Epithele typhae TaxID=378194 RepID=UPI0020077E45|nr:uncharacterized protein BXZ73DRAFT_52866 [Epithele typhae]KAH9918531.1 hypothetical protein BXZ73DRAFT_52866 [Epithele typhae]